LRVPEGSPAADRTLRDLAPAQSHMVQVTGLNRGRARILSPRGDEKVQPGDELLVLGTPDHIRVFKEWINEGADADAGAGIAGGGE